MRDAFLCGPGQLCRGHDARHAKRLKKCFVAGVCYGDHACRWPRPRTVRRQLSTGNADLRKAMHSLRAVVIVVVHAQGWMPCGAASGASTWCLKHGACRRFFSRAFFRSVSVAIKGAPGTRVLQTVFSEVSFLTCTLFLRRVASSRAHDGYRAGSRDAPGEEGHAARRSLKSGQGPSRLLRPGEGKEVRLSAKASEAAAHNTPDHGRRAGRRASGAARALARARRRRKEAASDPQRPPTSTPITTRRQRALARSSG